MKVSKNNWAKLIYFSLILREREEEKFKIFRTLAYVRKYIKNLGITFQVSNKLTSAVKEGLRLWLKVDILNKKELEFANNFAKKVPLWYKKAKSDTRLFTAHQCKYPLFSDFRLRVSCTASWLIFFRHHCTEVHFSSFLYGGFTTMSVINPPERKLAKPLSIVLSSPI